MKPSNFSNLGLAIGSLSDHCPIIGSACVNSLEVAFATWNLLSRQKDGDRAKTPANVTENEEDYQVRMGLELDEIIHICELFDIDFFAVQETDDIDRDMFSQRLLETGYKMIIADENPPEFAKYNDNGLIYNANRFTLRNSTQIIPKDIDDSSYHTAFLGEFTENSSGKTVKYGSAHLFYKASAQYLEGQFEKYHDCILGCDANHSPFQIRHFTAPDFCTNAYPHNNLIDHRDGNLKSFDGFISVDNPVKLVPYKKFVKHDNEVIYTT